MLKNRRIVLLFALAFAFAIWIQWWSSIGFPLEHQICREGEATKDCTSYNIFFYSGWALANAADHWGVLITAIATISIGYFTFTLKQSTDKLRKAGEDQFRFTKDISDRQAIEIQDQIGVARDAAISAQKSADAAVASERARLYVIVEHNFLDCINSAVAWENTPSVNENPVAASNLPMAKFKFRNHGKTPGILVEVSSGIVFSENVPEPVYDEKIVRDNIIAYDQSSEEFTEVISGAQMTIGAAKKVRSGEGNIWIFGRAEYDDIFGERKTHRFFQRMVGVGHTRRRFVLQSYDYKHYNKST